MIRLFLLLLLISCARDPVQGPVDKTERIVIVQCHENKAGVWFACYELKEDGIVE